MPDSWKAQSQSQNIIVVRGLSRGCGSTTIAANLVAELARSSDQRILLLDLSLWNTDLTVMGGLAPGQGLVEFGQAVLEQSALAPGIIRNQITRYQPIPFVDILPGTRDWVECSVLREVNGQLVIHEALKHVASSYDYVLVEIGANSQNPPTYFSNMLPACALHQAVLNASCVIIDVFGSLADFNFGVPKGGKSDFSAEEVFVINRSIGLDRALALTSDQFEPGVRERTVFIPEVPSLVGVQKSSVVIDKIAAGSRLSKKEDAFRKGIGKIAEVCLEKTA